VKFLVILSFVASVHGDLSGERGTSEFEHPEGSVYVKPADINPGCARFYISDPIKEEKGTKYWQVCTKVRRDHAAKMSIGSGVFSKIKDKYGMETQNSISFISTGPSTWVDIYAQGSQGGAHYEITPLRDVDLSLVTSLDNPDETTFNDNILSGFIRSSDARHENPDGLLSDVGQEPIAVYYRFVGTGRVEPENGCAYFYDSDPTENHEANGFTTCVSHDQHLAHVSKKDMEERGHILLGPQPFVNGTISPKQNTKAGYPQDENGNPVEPEPWSGDEAHDKEADAKYGRNMLKLRRLDAHMEPKSASSNETLLEIIEEDVQAAWEAAVGSFDWMFSSVVSVLLGENNTKAAPHVSPSAEQLPPHVTSEDHTGIKYIEAGLMVDVAAWTNDDFTGKQSLITAGNVAILDHVVNSFFLVSKKYHANKVKPAGGYVDVDEQPIVPQMNVDTTKVSQVSKKKDYVNMWSRSARKAAMMRQS